MQISDPEACSPEDCLFPEFTKGRLMATAFARFDDFINQIEKYLVLVFLSVMTAVVFLDVVHRTASSPEGFFLSILLKIAGAEASPDTRELITTWLAPGLLRLLTFGIVYAALQSAMRTKQSKIAVLGEALVLSVLLEVGLRLMLWLFPNGLVWSQPLSLSLLLWVAMVGATLATKERGHIVLQIADRIWPGPALRWVRLSGGLLTAAFCVAVAVLGVHYTADFYEQWKMGVGFVSGIAIPRWAVYTAIPTCFLLMALRFGAYAVLDFLYGPPPSFVEGEQEIAALVASQGEGEELASAGIDSSGIDSAGTDSSGLRSSESSSSVLDSSVLDSSEFGKAGIDASESDADSDEFNKKSLTTKPGEPS